MALYIVLLRMAQLYTYSQYCTFYPEYLYTCTLRPLYVSGNSLVLYGSGNRLNCSGIRAPILLIVHCISTLMRRFSVYDVTPVSTNLTASYSIYGVRDTVFTAVSNHAELCLIIIGMDDGYQYFMACP